MDSKFEGLKPFVITFEAQIIVLARDEEHAIEIADENHYDWIGNLYDSIDLDSSMMTYLPGGWDQDSLVYHDIEGEDISVGDILEWWDTEKRQPKAKT